MRFTHHFWRDIASGASYASYTSKTLTIGFGIINSKLADFNDDEAIQAFNQLKDFIADNNSTAEEISDAYLLQGLLVAFNPFLTGCENDYSGMVYFHKAI